MFRLLSSVSGAILAAALAVPQTASADACSPARTMIVFDRSSSMVTGKINNVTKWDIAVQGLGQVLASYETKAEFGLMAFPRPSQCSPGRLDVAPALVNRSAILNALATPPPDAGNWTPIAQTLEVAAAEPSLVNAAGAKHVVLITDGWQWCSPYDPATRYDGVDAVAALNTAGVTTWIVGFGAEVDASALNQMAVVAGTAKAGCNAMNTDPAAPDQCYHQVDNATQLVAALQAIAGSIVADEQCDGIDNDCDGQIDEDLVRDCSNSCGSGSEVCSAGGWSDCSAPSPKPETCDGDDNDCDGTVDDGANCDANPETDDGGMHAGCGCESSSGHALALPCFALGLLLLARRRR